MVYPATITQKGQVTIPAAIRHYLGLKTSDKLWMRVENEKIIAEPIKGSILDLYGSIRYKGKKQVNPKAVRRYVIRKIAENAAKEGL